MSNFPEKKKSLEMCCGITETNSHMGRAAQQHLPAGREWEIGNGEVLMDPKRFFHDALSGYWSSALAVIHFSGTPF